MLLILILILIACGLATYFYLTGPTPTPAPVFTPGQTVRLTGKLPQPLAQTMPATPVQGVVAEPMKIDKQWGTVAVRLDGLDLIVHIAPTHLEAVLTEI